MTRNGGDGVVTYSEPSIRGIMQYYGKSRRHWRTEFFVRQGVRERKGDAVFTYGEPYKTTDNAVLRKITASSG